MRERKLEEILKSVMETEPGKLARAVQEAFEEAGSPVSSLAILGAAIANMDERLQKLEAEKEK